MGALVLLPVFLIQNVVVAHRGPVNQYPIDQGKESNFLRDLKRELRETAQQTRARLQKEKQVE